MSRKVNISKIEATTVVRVFDSDFPAEENIINYNTPNQIHIVANQIYVYSELPVLSFSFDEIDNPHGATSLEEYLEVMAEREYFSLGGNSGSVTTGLYKKILIDGVFSVEELPDNSGYVFSVANASELNLSWQIGSLVFDYGNHLWVKDDVDLLGDGVERRIDAIYFSETGTVEYLKGSEENISYPTTPPDAILKTFVIITPDGVYFEDGDYIEKLSEKWGGYWSTLPETTFTIVNVRNIIVNATTANHTFKNIQHVSWGMTPWDGMTARIGRQENGNEVTIKHNKVEQNRIPFFFPNQTDYELRQGEILTFSLTRVNPFSPVSETNPEIYKLISSNMGPGGVTADQIIYDNSESELDAEDVQGAIDDINKKNKSGIGSTVRKLDNIPFLEVTIGSWDENFRELGNIIYDEDIQEFILCYSGYTLPYTDDSVYIGIATSPTGEPGTWTKRGINGDGRAFTFTNAEDPYIVKKNGVYTIFYEDLKNLTEGLQSIGMATTSNLDGEWINQGIITGLLPGLNSNEYVGSPTVVIDNNDKWFMFYEYLHSNTSLSDARGSIYRAISYDGFNWGELEKVAGSENISWSTSSVPDDIIEHQGLYYMTVHNEMSFKYNSGILYADKLDGVWLDYIGGPIWEDDASELSSGQGIMMYRKKNGNLICAYISSPTSGIFRGKFINKTSYNWRVRDTQLTSASYGNALRGVINGNTSELITYTQTTQTPPTLLRSDSSGRGGVSKIIHNNSNFPITINLDNGVSVDGSITPVVINPGDFLWLISTGVDMWKRIDINSIGRDITSDDVSNESNVTGATVTDALNNLDTNKVEEGIDSEETIKFLSVKDEMGVEPETIYFVPKSHNTIHNGQLTIFKYPSNTEKYPEENDFVEGFMNEVTVDPITEEETYTLWFVRGKYLGTGSFFNIDNYELLNGSTEWD